MTFHLLQSARHYVVSSLRHYVFSYNGPNISMEKFHDDNNYSVTELEFPPIVNTQSVEMPIINTKPT